MGEKLSNALKKKDEIEIDKNSSNTSRTEATSLRLSTEPKEEKKYVPKLCEKNTKYQKYLKFMVKNNYKNLSYEDLCSFFIQFCWRKFYINKKIERKNSK